MAASRHGRSMGAAWVRSLCAGRQELGLLYYKWLHLLPWLPHMCARPRVHILTYMHKHGQLWPTGSVGAGRRVSRR